MPDPLERWILDYDFGHYIWTSILNSAYIDWTDNDHLNFAVASKRNQHRWRRSGGNSYESPDEWATATVGLNYVTHLRVNNDLKTAHISQTNVSGTSTTTLGVRYWFEFNQRLGDRDGLEPGEKTPAGPVVASPVRIPAPDGWRDDIQEWAGSYPGGEITRVKPAVFDERFSEVTGMSEAEAVNRFNDFHVKIPGIEDRDTLQQVWDESVQLVQRIVRSEG